METKKKQYTREEKIAYYRARIKHAQARIEHLSAEPVNNHDLAQTIRHLLDEATKLREENALLRNRKAK